MDSPEMEIGEPRWGRKPMLMGYSPLRNAMRNMRFTLLNENWPSEEFADTLIVCFEFNSTSTQEGQLGPTAGG